ADKQGLYFQPSQGTAENYFLSTGELLQLKAVAECIASGRSGAITVNQVVWKESYTYDPNGNRTSKTTAWGTVEYSYDKENRLVESGNLGMSESVKYTYDKNGNLLRESAARYRKDYTYNAQNRMSFSDVQDSVLNTRNFTEYAYDAFGRRIETRQYLGDYTRNLYDGFSFDVIGKSLLQTSYPMALSEQKYRDARTGHPGLVSGSAQTTSGTTSSGRNAAGTEIGTRYRYIDDTPLVPLSEAAAGGSSSAAAGGAKTRSRASSEYVLYSHGVPAAVNSDDGTSYFGTDILGSVRNVTDKYGAEQTSYDYDAFGSPYLGNLDNGMSFGYTGKAYDAGTGLYDYGFRDYSPNNARFTTVDPIRDGSNWFSYVVNDPVNYVDPLGLKTFEEIKEKAKAIVNDFVYGKQETIEVDGQKITVQKSSPLLKAAPFAKAIISAGMIATGTATGNSLLIAGGIAISQLPTGRVDNQTGDYLAFAGEHTELGQVYLEPGVTYVFKDYATTRGEYSGYTVKTNPISNMTVATEGTKLSGGTVLINSTWNGVKSLLRTEPGQWFNNTVIKWLLNHPLTTEPYGVYNNSQVLTNSVIGRNDKFINLHGLSGNLNDYKYGNNPNNAQYANPQYFSENNNSASSANNVTFKNINFDGSGSVYIGFNGFSMGCSK
ncbi:MAG: RHS repeat-associated core domain-containing protein, partial [Spirochaetales bacterium]|nr:RHS repeat-associated core domain-containing protein [Spirochaetales bacterium]